MLIPSRASIETVNAVPYGVSLRSVIWRRPRSSQRSGVRQRQMSPRPSFAMNAIASGVANWAAIVRSPSFSRSAASTTTTNLPGADVLDCLFDSGERGLGDSHRPMVSRSTYLARTSTSRLTASPGFAAPSVVAASVCGTSATAKPAVVEGGDGERDAVDRDRPLLDAVAEHIGRRVDPDGLRETLRNRPTPSTWPWTMWPPSGSPARSAGSTLTRSSAVSAPSVVRLSVSATTSNASWPPSCSTTVRQTPSTATESPTSARRLRSLDDQAGAVEGDDASELANDAGEHGNRLRHVDVCLDQHVLARAVSPSDARARRAPRARRETAAPSRRGRARRTRAACRRARRGRTRSRASGRPRAAVTARRRRRARAALPRAGRFAPRAPRDRDRTRAGAAASSRRRRARRVADCRRGPCPSRPPPRRMRRAARARDGATPRRRPSVVPGTTTRPSSETATLYVTNGRPSDFHVRHASFWTCAAQLSSSSTSTPASRSRSIPPAAFGFGSRAPTTTRATPAAITASEHGGVRPV